MNCPQHDTPMVHAMTQYGALYTCPVPGCDVRCWGGRTSTPADGRTRRLRSQCHAEFDPLWRTRVRFKTRSSAYAWMSRVLGLTRDEAHIGHLSAAQCEQLLEVIRTEGVAK